MTGLLAAPVLSLVVLGTLVLTCPGPAVAGTVPDTIQMALLRYAVAEVRLVRVEGDFGTRWGRRPLIDSSGVQFGEELKGRANTMRVPGDVASIPWTEISTIQTDRATSGRGAMIGLAIGLLAGSVIALSSINFFSMENQQHKANIIWQVGVGGMALGFLAGKRGETKVIYPPPAARHQ
jgi:hypothetical protein